MKTEDNTTNREMDLMKSAWPPKDIVSKLIEAADILLHKKDYDGHGWEEIEYCFRMAKEWFESSQSQPQPTKIDEDCTCINCDEKKETHNICSDCLHEIINENKLPTKIDEGFISVEDAMPPLAPADECVNELPFSQPVIVKNEIGKEMNGLYDFTERSWIDPVCENNIEYSEEIDGKAEYDHKITHWKAIVKLLNQDK